MNSRARHPYLESRFEHQLEMVRPSRDRVEMSALPAGYALRHFREEDERAYEELFALGWTDKGTLAHTRRYALPAGFVVIEHSASRLLVASCVAFSPESPERHPDDGSLGWLVTDPAHGRRGLATAAAATVTNRLVDEGYARPWLGTEDDRLAALDIYLNLGWRPYLYATDMESRWRAILARLGRAFSLESCVRT
ncbi:MAG: GNAT family N-acetyltransferase [Dehalococcoidia bacterium]